MTTANILCIATALSVMLPFAAVPGATEKLVDKILFPCTKEHYRWSEGSILNLDGKDHLVMAVTAFGSGGHDHSGARILEFHSHDGGLTWESLEEAKVLQANVGKQTVMNPTLLRLDNGEILCFVSVKNSIRDCGPWVKRSTDDGQKWSKLRRLPYEGYGGVGCDRALQISSGRIVVPGWVSMDALGSTHAYCCYSDDDGHTWQKTALITTPKGSTGRRTNPAAEEPMVIELTDGRLMMIVRTYLKSIYKCYSTDGGATWSKPVNSGIPSPGSMATIKRLPNGDILLIWNWARLQDLSGPWPRNFISSAISKDDGRNFSCVRHLDGAADFPGKITMANVTFATNDKVVITYSKSMTKKNAYNWRLQVIPLQWFYEGDTAQVYGEAYLPTLNAWLKRAKTSKSSAPVLEFASPSEAELKMTLANADGSERDLIASYHFDEGEGKFALDTSPSANHGTLQKRGDFPKWGDGKQGRGMELDGKAGFIAAPHKASLSFKQSTFTVEGWIHPTTKKKHSIIATKEHMWEIGLLDGRLKAAVQCGKSWGPGWAGQTEVPLNQWTHFAVTYDGRRIRIFVNGECTDNVLRVGKMDVTPEPLVIGGCTHIRDSVFAGRIDELKISQTVRIEPKGDAAMGNSSQEPWRVDSVHQLFVDDELIAQVDGLQRVVNQPVKHHDNPVLTYEHPWEGNCVITWGSVIYDGQEEVFKVWYEAYKKFPKHGDGTILCYATSRDGITWQKPELGIYDYLGSTANNIVFWLKGKGIDAPTVLAVPNPTPDVKYRMYFHQKGGIYTATSSDGLHWNLNERVLIEAGDRNSAHYDPERGKFIVITRIPGRGMRTCGLWESDDGESFTHVGEIVAPDKHDPAETQLYGMIYFNYAGLRLGFLEMFYVPTRLLDTQLVYSRDGLGWHRACDRMTFLSRGPAGAWDYAWVTPSQNPPIRVGDRLYIFYQGRQTLHWAVEPYGHIGSIGLAFLRPDGFVSLDAQCEEGCVTTMPLLLDGEALHINAAARPGYVTAEIADANGDAVEGFSREDCVPMSMEDSLDHAVMWRNGKSVGALRGRPVRLRFYMRGAKLYSFWMS